MSETRLGAMVQRASIATKWTAVGSSIIAATQNIAGKSKHDNATVEDVLDFVSNLRGVSLIRVYSGVHGTPSGLIQVDDPDFTVDDAADFEQDEDDLTIEVRGMRAPAEMGGRIPDDLLADLNDPDVFVILGWCYSAEYLKFHNFKPSS
ncbi:hypothetical protein [Roseomonas rosulenta]|uniref:hypothetical protein n=1 Tax=Roseomonas rosulenta TaxID=2748667 RepID=UPI0018DFAC4E|nr:hypothetical protein [Roseomonas rosulenta]